MIWAKAKGFERELLPSDLSATKISSALVRVLRDLAGLQKLAISFFSNHCFNPNLIFSKIDLKCFRILFFFFLLQIGFVR